MMEGVAARAPQHGLVGAEGHAADRTEALGGLAHADIPPRVSSGPERSARRAARPRVGSPHARAGVSAKRRPVAGVALVVRDGAGRVLLGRRAVGWGAGAWCIPCGAVEWGEDARAAAERELLEETGVRARAGEPLAVHSNFHDPERLTVGVWFAAEDARGDPFPADGELSAVAYFDPADPPPLAFPTDALVLARLAREDTGPKRARGQ